MKFWKSMPAMHSVVTGIWATIAYLAGPSWIGMFCAALAGYALGTALRMIQCDRWRALFEHTRDALNEMTEINDALLHNRVTLHFLGETPPICLPDERKPRLH